MEQEKASFTFVHQPKFRITMDSTGRVELVISTDNEEELRDLLATWEPVIIPDFTDAPQNGKVISLHKNGNDKPRYFVGDQCPQCGNRLIESAVHTDEIAYISKKRPKALCGYAQRA